MPVNTPIHTALLLLFAVTALAQPSVGQLEARWQYSTGSPIHNTPALYQTLVFVAGDDGKVHALDRETGTVKWAYDCGSAIRSDLVVDEDRLYAYSTGGLLFAFGVESGAVRWTFQTYPHTPLDTWDYYAAAPAYNDKHVFVADSEGIVYALQKSNGALAWQSTTGARVHATPACTDSSVFVGNYNGELISLHATTGQPKWTFRTIGDRYFPNGEIQRGPVLEDGVLYFGCRDYNLYAVDANTGRGIWNMKERGSWIIATPCLDSTQLYVGTSDTHTFYALDKSDGHIRWQLPLNMRVYGTATLHRGIVYFGCFNGKLYGVEAKSGQILQQFQTRASRENYARVYGPDDGFKPGFDLYGPDGEQAEQAILSLGSLLSQPIVVDGHLFVTSADGNLYAIRTDFP